MSISLSLSQEGIINNININIDKKIITSYKEKPIPLGRVAGGCVCVSERGKGEMEREEKVMKGGMYF